MKTGFFVLLALIVNLSVSLAQCADLRGTYSECKLIGNSEEKFTFEFSQGFRAGDVIFRAKGLRDGKPLVVPFLANGSPQPLVSDKGEVLAPISLNYVSVCDPNQLILTVTSPALGEAASEKFFVSKSADGNLVILNKSLVLGQVVSERSVICESL